MIETSPSLSRHSFSARDAARAGDVWRLCQDVAVEASTRCGWPPLRYREEQNAFVVRSMIVVHHAEALYGEPLVGTTWVSRMRREMLSTREVRIRAARGPIATARQEWVHVGATLEPTRAPSALLEAFRPEEGPPGDRPPELPAIATPIEPQRAPRVFSFRAWFTWMDPLDHVNHPAYVDFCDEAISVAMHEAGLSPVSLAPVAEELTFRAGVGPGDAVRVESHALGWTSEGHAVIAHRILAGDALAASGKTVRCIVGEEGPSALGRLL